MNSRARSPNAESARSRTPKDPRERRLRRGEVSGEAVEAVVAAAEAADLDYIGTEMPRALEESLDGVARISDIVRAMKEFSHPGEISFETKPGEGTVFRLILPVGGDAHE